MLLLLLFLKLKGFDGKLCRSSLLTQGGWGQLANRRSHHRHLLLPQCPLTITMIIMKNSTSSFCCCCCCCNNIITASASSWDALITSATTNDNLTTAASWSVKTNTTVAAVATMIAKRRVGA